MSDFSENWFQYIVYGFFGIIAIILLGTVVLGDNSCSRPKRKTIPPGSQECSVCHGTGFVRSQERNFSMFTYYENTKCSKCSGTGYYNIYILID